MVELKLGKQKATLIYYILLHESAIKHPELFAVLRVKVVLVWRDHQQHVSTASGSVANK
jgi:hypothetical protein